MVSPLKAWRDRRALNVTEAAAVVGVTPGMWSRWENARRKIPPLRAVEIEGKTGIDRHDLRPDLFDAPAVPRETAGVPA